VVGSAGKGIECNEGAEGKRGREIGPPMCVGGIQGDNGDMVSGEGHEEFIVIESLKRKRTHEGRNGTGGSFGWRGGLKLKNPFAKAFELREEGGSPDWTGSPEEGNGS